MCDGAPSQQLSTQIKALGNVIHRSLRSGTSLCSSIRKLVNQQLFHVEEWNLYSETDGERVAYLPSLYPFCLMVLFYKLIRKVVRSTKPFQVRVKWTRLPTKKLKSPGSCYTCHRQKNVVDIALWILQRVTQEPCIQTQDPIWLPTYFHLQSQLWTGMLAWVTQRGDHNVWFAR